MKNTVKIDGVEVTREWVGRGIREARECLEKLQKAQMELDTPDPIRNLTRVRMVDFPSHEGVAIIGSAQQLYAKAAKVTGAVTVIGQLGGGNTYDTEAQMLRVWEVVE